MPPSGAPGFVAPRRSTATPRLYLPMSTILISRSPPPGALTTFWISSALTIVATSFCACENALDGASTITRAANPSIMRCIAASPFPLRRPLLRRQSQNLCRVDLEQLCQLLLAEPVRAQHLGGLGERIRLKVGIDLAGIGRHERVVDADSPDGFDVLFHHLRACVLVAELRREFRVDFRADGDRLLELVERHVDDVEQ